MPHIATQRNAFGAVPHSQIFGTLKEMGLPHQLQVLISVLYQSGSTRIRSKEGYSEPVPVTQGVRQGCPLSPVIFNLTMEPLLRVLLGTAGYRIRSNTICCLAYADDPLLVARDAGMLRALLWAAGEVAKWYGLDFKAWKCETLHLDCSDWHQRGVQNTTFQIQGKDIRTLGVAEHYRYLGAPVGYRVDQAPTETLSSVLEDLKKIDRSELAPWQKLDTLRVFILLRFEYILRCTAVTKKNLRKADREMARMCRKWTARKATRQLGPIMQVRWEWSAAKGELAIRLQVGDRPPTILPTSAVKVCSNLRSAVRESYQRKVVAKLDQGKAYEMASTSPASNHFLRTGLNTRFCDWRFVHQARLNVIPLKGAYRGVRRWDSSCRRCGDQEETLPH
ncbi:hypothetical protein J437_LFUL001256, partial [Ladona fulva]